MKHRKLIKKSNQNFFFDRFFVSNFYVWGGWGVGGGIVDFGPDFFII
jgi:hypothetical protein